MRQSQKGNRPRSKNGRKPNGPSPNRVYESSGPEGKVRGTPQQIIERYQSLARDKATSGDSILSESFLQHAEHYVRILNAAQAAQAPARREEEDVTELENDYAPAQRGDNGAGSFAVMDGDENASDMVSTPETFGGGSSGQRRAPRRRDEDSEADENGARRRPRRAPRRSREANGEGEQPTIASDATQNGAANGADADDDQPRAPSRPRRRSSADKSSSESDLVDMAEAKGSDANRAEEDWSSKSAVGHA